MPIVKIPLNSMIEYAARSPLEAKKPSKCRRTSIFLTSDR